MFGPRFFFICVLAANSGFGVESDICRHALAIHSHHRVPLFGPVRSLGTRSEPGGGDELVVEVRSQGGPELRFYEGRLPIPDAHPEHALRSAHLVYFSPDANRRWNLVLLDPSSAWTQSTDNPAANCHAFSTAAVVGIPANYWLNCLETWSQILRYYFSEREGGGPSSDWRDGDLLVFSQSSKPSACDLHSGIAVLFEGKRYLLHKLGEGPVVLTPWDDPLSRYKLSAANIRRYRPKKE